MKNLLVRGTEEKRMLTVDGAESTVTDYLGVRVQRNYL